MAFPTMRNDVSPDADEIKRLMNEKSFLDDLRKELAISKIVTSVGVQEVVLRLLKERKVAGNTSYRRESDDGESRMSSIAETTQEGGLGSTLQSYANSFRFNRRSSAQLSPCHGDGPDHAAALRYGRRPSIKTSFMSGLSSEVSEPAVSTNEKIATDKNHRSLSSDTEWAISSDKNHQSLPAVADWAPSGTRERRRSPSPKESRRKSREDASVNKAEESGSDRSYKNPLAAENDQGDVFGPVTEIDACEYVENITSNTESMRRLVEGLQFLTSDSNQDLKSKPGRDEPEQKRNYKSKYMKKSHGGDDRGGWGQNSIFA